jgi:ubiquitin thioesterase OTU1
MCGTAKPSNYVASSSSSSSSGSNNKRMNTTTAATLHKIPDDNSCLFHAVTFLLGRSESPTQLRQIIAQTVRSNPAQFSAAILGKSREAYVTFITDPTKWGGQVELNILSSRFCAELAAIDIQSGRCDIYGEGSGFSERVYLCFTGIHFDAVVFGKTGGKTGRRRMSPHDQSAHRAAEALASSLRRTGQFTDKKTMTLVCKTCGHTMNGDYEARLHAGSSGHKDFAMKKAN